MHKATKNKQSFNQIWQTEVLQYCTPPTKMSPQIQAVESNNPLTNLATIYASRVLLLLLTAFKYTNLSPSNINTFDKVKLYLDKLSSISQHLHQLLYHGLEFERLEKLNITYGAAFPKLISIAQQIDSGVSKFMLDKKDKRVTIHAIIDLLHGFRFDNNLDMLFNLLIKTNETNHNLKILTFGTKNSLLIQSINNNSQLEAYSHDIGRWRENYLLGLLYDTPQSKSYLQDILCQESLQNLSYDYIVLSANSTKKFPDYDIDYYKHFTNLNDDKINQKLNRLQHIFNTHEDILRLRMGNSNLFLYHILFALQKLKPNTGQLFLLIKDSDSFNNYIMIEYLQPYITGIIYLKSKHENRILYILEWQKKLNHREVYYINVELDKPKNNLYQYLQRYNGQCGSPWNYLLSQDNLLRVKTFDDFFISGIKLHNLYQFNLFNSASHRNSDNIDKYFDLLRFRLPTVAQHNTITQFIQINTDNLQHDTLCKQHLKYITEETFHNLFIMYNDELKAGDIIINRKYTPHNLNCILLEDSDFINELGDPIRLIPNDNIHILRLNDDYRNDFLSKYTTIRNFYIIFHQLIKLHLQNKPPQKYHTFSHKDISSFIIPAISPQQLDILSEKYNQYRLLQERIQSTQNELYNILDSLTK